MFTQEMFSSDKKNRNSVSFEESDVIFVADFFADEYTGGAELTTEAVFKTSPYNTYKLKSSDLNQELIGMKRLK